MPRLFFLNRFFYPDHSATSQILSDLTFHLALVGYDVHVVTSRSIYDNTETDLPVFEWIQGVKIQRLSTTRFGRRRLLGRILDYTSFYCAMARYLLKHVDKDDVIIAKTDPPLLSIPAQWIARRRGARTINWLQDIYPEVATALGVPLLKGPVARALSALRDRSLRSADANVVLGENMQQRLLTRGIDRDHIHIIPNWTDDEQISAISAIENGLRVEWNLEHKFVVGYSGNLGRAHEFQTLLDAAENLRHQTHIVFLFIGGGHHTKSLMDQVETRGLKAQFRFLPYQPRELLSHSLSVPDVHWISLKPELEGLIFPSKLYGIAAAGRPMIAVTVPDGEIARLVIEHDCGVVASPGHSDTLTTHILALSLDADRCRSLGNNARKMLEERFTRRHAFERWYTLLRSLN